MLCLDKHICKIHLYLAVNIYHLCNLCTYTFWCVTLRCYLHMQIRPITKHRYRMCTFAEKRIHQIPAELQSLEIYIFLFMRCFFDLPNKKLYPAKLSSCHPVVQFPNWAKTLTKELLAEPGFFLAKHSGVEKPLFWSWKSWKLMENVSFSRRRS